VRLRVSKIEPSPLPICASSTRRPSNTGLPVWMARTRPGMAFWASWTTPWATAWIGYSRATNAGAASAARPLADAPMVCNARTK
jgi:hypothetical protein